MRFVFMPLTPPMWPMVEEKLGLNWQEDIKGILVWDTKERTFAAGVIFEDWTYSSVQVHQWVENALVLRHGLYNEVVRYAMDVAGMLKLIGIVPEDNEAALKLNKHIGFREVCRIADGFKPGVASVILEADRNDLVRWTNRAEAA